MPTMPPYFHHARHRPADAARDVVSEYWVVQAERCATAVEAALPDGSAELYFNLGPAGRHVVEAPSLQAPARQPPHRAAWVVGPRAAALLVAKETADCDIVGVRLRAGAVARVLGVPAGELAGRLVDLDCLWGSAVGEIRERLAAAGSPAERVRVVERAVLRRCARVAEDDDGARARALCAALAAPGASVADVGAAFGVSAHRLIRLFDHHVGLKPKTYQRIRRLRRVMAAAGATPRPAWAALAARLGYHDQAHMIHDFRTLTGLTPREYAARRTSVGVGFVPHVRVPGG
jgi:AraC-like DNA-binding protein